MNSSNSLLSNKRERSEDDQQTSTRDFSALPQKSEFMVMLDLYTTLTPSNEDTGNKSESNGKAAETFYEKEVIPHVLLTRTADDKVKLKELIMVLKKCGYPLTTAHIYPFDKVSGDYVRYNLEFNSEIDVKGSSIIKLKCECYLDDNFAKTVGSKPVRQNSQIERAIVQDSNLKKRTKERKISFIIEKVNLWRKLYTGFPDENGKLQKYSLESAAEVIGISKKSLDDYLLQLRYGRKYCYNFNENKDCNVGHLRKFVRDERKKREKEKRD